MNPLKKFNEWRPKNDGWDSLLSFIALLAYMAISYSIYQRVGQWAAIIFYIVTLGPYFTFLLWHSHKRSEMAKGVLASLWWVFIISILMFFGIKWFNGGIITMVIFSIGAFIFCVGLTTAAQSILAWIKKFIQR